MLRKNMPLPAFYGFAVRKLAAALAPASLLAGCVGSGPRCRGGVTPPFGEVNSTLQLQLASPPKFPRASSRGEERQRAFERHKLRASAALNATLIPIGGP